MHSMVILTNDIILHAWKWLREFSRCTHTHLCEVMEVLISLIVIIISQHVCVSSHPVVPLKCCMSTVLYVHYISIKWGEKNSGVCPQSKGEFFFFMVTAQSFIQMVQTKDSTLSRHEGRMTPRERPQSVLAFSFCKLCLLPPEPQFSRSVGSDSLRPHGLQHARLPCPSPTPGACSNSCPSNGWCHPTISSFVVSFSPCLQSFPASGYFQMSQFFSSGAQSIRVSASTSVPPMNIQDWFPLGWTPWVSLLSKTRHLSLLQHHSSKASILLSSAFFIVQLSHPYMTP